MTNNLEMKGDHRGVLAKRLSPDVRLPVRGSEGAAGLDLFCADEAILKHGEVKRVSTGFAFEIPPGCYGLIAPRSSISLKNITVFPTVVDCDYRGELFVTVRFDGEGEYRVRKNDRLAQMVVMPYANVGVTEVTELTATKRGAKGYGSTGR